MGEPRYSRTQQPSRDHLPDDAAAQSSSGADRAQTTLWVPKIHPRKSERWLMITYLESWGREFYTVAA
jgi:hypothetical protein